MQLSKNFSLQEMIKSETALRHDMDNTPGTTEIANLVALCEKVLQPVRDHYARGVKVNSGYRHPDVNAKVGGSKTSDHCKGMAADIIVKGMTPQQVADAIERLMHKGDIIKGGLKAYPTFCHVDIRGKLVKF
jgi:uncharacterized protein YcbK (DUF882 family)